MIAAGIDIGTNSFRMLIARIDDGRMVPLVKKLDTVRLGAGLQQSGCLSTDAMNRALAVLASYREELTSFEPMFCRACGTAALRLATNRDQFLADAQQTLGMAVEVISGEEEAILSLNGALAAIRKPADRPLFKVDVGGGSTELVMVPAENSSPGPHAAKIDSLPLGAVSLTEQFLRRPTATAAEIQELERHVTVMLRPAVAALFNSSGVEPYIVGSGGTATAMAALALQLAAYDESKVQGYELTGSQVKGLWQKLAALAAAERNQLPGLEQGRGSIILAGIKIYQILLEQLGADSLVISDAGLLEGIVLSRIPESANIHISYA